MRETIEQLALRVRDVLGNSGSGLYERQVLEAAFSELAKHQAPAAEAFIGRGGVSIRYCLDGELVRLAEYGAHIPRLPLYTHPAIPKPAAVPDEHKALEEVVGCFDAAECEGLTTVLLETSDERLKDLVERRLMYALYAAQQALQKSAAPVPPSVDTLEEPQIFAANEIVAQQWGVDPMTPFVRLMDKPTWDALCDMYRKSQVPPIQEAKDAEMLDWLIKNADATVCSDGAYGPYHVWFRYSNRTTDEFKTPHEAIRAAMSASKEASYDNA